MRNTGHRAIHALRTIVMVCSMVCSHSVIRFPIHINVYVGLTSVVCAEMTERDECKAQTDQS